MTASDHDRLLRIFYLIHACFLAVVASFSLIIAVAGFATAPARGTPEMIGNVIGMLIGFCLVLLLGIPAMIAALASWKHRSWTRIAYIVAAIFALFLFPFGTALGAYTLWFAFSDVGKNLYQS